MSLIDTLKAKSKAELEALVPAWEAHVPQGAKATKEELIAALVQTNEAQRQNLAGNARKMVVAQCEARHIPDAEIDQVMAHIEKSFGAPLADLTVPNLNRLARNIDSVMRDYLGGAKRRQGRRLPAGLS